MDIKQLEQRANNIPTMVPDECKARIRKAASEVKAGCIVEVGPWIGACTAQIALGLIDSGKRIQVHCFDYFECNSKKQEAKALVKDVILRKGESYLDIFLDNLAPFKQEIFPYSGNNKEIKWNKSKKIALYIDDASKKQCAFDHMVKTFFPALLPGAIVMLLDFFYFETKPNNGYEYQMNWMGKHKKNFDYLGRVEGHANAFFKYKGGLDG